MGNPCDQKNQLRNERRWTYPNCWATFTSYRQGRPAQDFRHRPTQFSSAGLRESTVGRYLRSALWDSMLSKRLSCSSCVISCCASVKRFIFSMRASMPSSASVSDIWNTHSSHHVKGLRSACCRSVVVQCNGWEQKWARVDWLRRGQVGAHAFGPGYWNLFLRLQYERRHCWIALRFKNIWKERSFSKVGGNASGR